MRRIAFTFAGRRTLMRNQDAFMRSALAAGLVDEWHVWDFAREPGDSEWLDSRFGSRVILTTEGRKKTYRTFAGGVGIEASLSVLARSDAHLLIEISAGFLVEIVLGAHQNTWSLLRCFDGVAYFDHAPPVGVSRTVLDPLRENDVSMCMEGRTLLVSLNGEPLFSCPTPGDLIQSIRVSTGFGSSGVWQACDEGCKIALVKSGLSSYEGFRHVYGFYSQARFANTIFLKLDDDIVFCDLERLSEFLSVVEDDEMPSLYSANVVNNGVCAYYQQRAGWYPNEGFDFEYPKDGYCGTLWGSAELCIRLHRAFLQRRQTLVEHASRGAKLTRLPPFDRFSINFVAFRHALMAMMVAAYRTYKTVDDEILMSQALPLLFGIEKRLWNPLVVSHFCFQKQYPHAGMDDILIEYAALAI